jgi:VIT1/CCC1 family predicted Fe2+/Mn2+ transporter
MSRHSLKVGFGFGVASGVITTLGLMIGLFSTTNSKIAVIGGVLTIALADSLADALGIHFSEESKGIHTTKVIWLSTIFTFLSKLVITLSFIPLIVFLPIKIGIILDIVWGFLLLSFYSYFMAKKQNNKPFFAIFEHVSIMIVVIICSYYIGNLIDKIY